MSTFPARSPVPPGLAGRLLARLGALALIGVLLVWLRPILMPTVLAILVAFLTFPIVRGLVRRRVPVGLSVLAAVVVVTLPVLLLILVFFSTIGPLGRELPKYQEQLVVEVDELVDRALRHVDDPTKRAALKQELSDNLLPRAIEAGVNFTRSGVTAATNLVGYFFLTLLFMAFMLFEGQRFREKFTEAYGDRHPLLQSLEAIGQDVRTYVIAKTLISGATGLAVWVFLEAAGVDFAVLWGLLAFPLNFIPTVGAALASIPPILLAMLDPEMTAWGVVGVTIGLFAVNGFIGSFIDPRFVGRQVKLSPLVVFFSMVIWGLLWGPVGMILAVPIMVSVKVICSHVRGLEPVAILLKA